MPPFLLIFFRGGASLRTELAIPFGVEILIVDRRVEEVHGLDFGDRKHDLEVVHSAPRERLEGTEFRPNGSVIAITMPP
jgi:hypothetical protein